MRAGRQLTDGTLRALNPDYFPVPVDYTRLAGHDALDKGQAIPKACQLRMNGTHDSSTNKVLIAFEIYKSSEGPLIAILIEERSKSL